MSRAGRSGCSGQVRGVQSLGGRVDLDGESVSRVKQSDHCTPDAVVITPFFETSGIFSTTLVGQAWRRSVKS